MVSLMLSHVVTLLQSCLEHQNGFHFNRGIQRQERNSYCSSCWVWFLESFHHYLVDHRKICNEEVISNKDVDLNDVIDTATSGPSYSTEAPKDSFNLLLEV